MLIPDAAGHVSRTMRSRPSHVWMMAKRRALDEIAARQNAADEKRKGEAERQQATAVVSQSALVQQSHGGETWVAQKRVRLPKCPSGRDPGGTDTSVSPWRPREDLFLRTPDSGPPAGHSPR